MYFFTGDGGYPIRTYFFTPLANPTTRAQQLYNESHIRTRNVVERVFGCWKRRFPVLAYGMRLKLQTILIVIVSTAVVYNFAKEMNEPDPPPADFDQHELEVLIADGQIPDVVDNNENVLINQVRNDFVNNYFALL